LNPAVRAVADWKKAARSRPAGEKLGHRSRVSGLAGQDHEGAREEEDTGHRHHELGVERPGAAAARSAESVEHLRDDRVPDAADHEERQDGEGDHRIGNVANQAIAEQAEAGVVERGDGVEAPQHERRRQRELPEPPGREGERPDRLDGGRHDEDAPDVPHEPLEGELVQAFLQGQAVAERDLPPQDERDEARHGHVPEAAGLDEREDHEVTEEREVLRGIQDDQAGHADRRRRREQSVHEGRRPGRCARDGQPQEHRPGRDHREEPKDEGLRRGDLPLAEALPRAPPREALRRRHHSGFG
jgi:hypothetical protein